MRWSRKKQFFITFSAFFVLGASFKVMTLIKGLTEVRPVNAIPLIAGLMFGPVGAFGCAFGNVAADLFGTFDKTSILGFLGNFLAAYLPYRTWYVFSKEEPHVHTWRNILLYIVLSVVSAMAVAYIIAFGLELFFGIWIKTLYIYVLLNDAGFSVFLGMPLFIVFKSDSINMKCTEPINSLLPKIMNARKNIIFILFSLCMVAMLAGVMCNLSMMSSVWMLVTGIVSMILLIFLLF